MKYRLSILAVTWILVLPSFCGGQEAHRKLAVFDSFGAINAEDASARLDNFAIALQIQPDYTAYIICWGPEGAGGGTGKFLIEAAKNYLVNSRGLEADRIQTIYAGRYKKATEIQAELWLLPPGSLLPDIKSYNTKPKAFAGKLLESKGWDAFGFGDECCGVGFGDTKLAAFADHLRMQPKSVAYIVAFSKRGSTPGTWRRVAKRHSDELKATGIEPDRIKIIYGGTFKAKEHEYEDARLQYWISSVEAPPPVKEAKPERTPREAVQLGPFDSTAVADPKEERRIFEGMVDVLRADTHLRVYIIHRAQIPTGYGEPADETPKLNPKELAEKWKGELQEKIGIREHRIILIDAGAEKFRDGIEVWFVPIGATLPDPHPPKEIDVEEP